MPGHWHTSVRKNNRNEEADILTIICRIDYYLSYNPILKAKILTFSDYINILGSYQKSSSFAMFLHQMPDWVGDDVRLPLQVILNT